MCVCVCVCVCVCACVCVRERERERKRESVGVDMSICDCVYVHPYIHFSFPYKFCCVHNCVCVFQLPSSAMDDIIDGMFEEALQEKPDLLQGPRCRARFDFEGEGQGDLAFEDGDVIQLLSHCGDDWLKGELNGNVGMFPASFVEIIEDLPEQKGVHDGLTGGGNEVTCLFDFSGEAGELSFQVCWLDRLKYVGVSVLRCECVYVSVSLSQSVCLSV